MDWLSEDERTVWHPYTAVPMRGPRALFTRAQGAYVYDSEGRGYFDSTSSWWCNLHGHCHPRLVEALHRQAAQLDQILLAPHTHPVAVELASRLLVRLGPPFEKVFYSDDGSTAVESALKMALQFWRLGGDSRRLKFASLNRAYHGDTLGAVSVSDLSEFHRFFGSEKAPTISLPYDRLADALRLLEENARDLAAFIVEPLVLGAAGMVMYPASYLEALVKRCRELGVLVIFDEVFTGFGRTGTFFAMEQITARPDIICLSKGLTSGMLPLAVTAASAKIYEAFVGGPERTFYHGHTFTGNALGGAVALESLKIFEQEKVLERNQLRIQQMAAERARFADLPHVAQVRQQGMIWALELTANPRTHSIPTPPNGPGWNVAEAAWEKGIWMRPLHQMLYCVPPYCASEEDLRRFFEVLYSELQDEKHFEEFKG